VRCRSLQRGQNEVNDQSKLLFINNSTQRVSRSALAVVIKFAASRLRVVKQSGVGPEGPRGTERGTYPSIRTPMGGTRNLKLGRNVGQGPGHMGQWELACGPNVDQGWNCRGGEGLGEGLNPNSQFMSTDAHF